MIPSRFTNLSEARSRFGDRVDRLGPYLMRVDELADRTVGAIEELPEGAGWELTRRMLRGERPLEAPDALREFFAAVERVPIWVDWGLVEDGSRVLVRAGPLGGLVLGLKSLVLAYTSPAGNKPLVFSGRMTEQAPRRLDETARFVRETISPGGMRPGAPGWQVTLQVRLIHARLRRMIVRSGRWDAGTWGAPINQHDQAGTSLLFSASVLEGLRHMGLRITSAEADAYMHLWRWSGWLIGVEPELLPGSESEAVRLGMLIRATQGPPDDDSRALTSALLHAPPRRAGSADGRAAERAVHVAAALCRSLIGEETADQLGVPRTAWRRVVPAVRRILSSVNRAKEAVPFAGDAALRAGQRYWDRALAVGLADATREFALPTRLGLTT